MLYTVTYQYKPYDEDHPYYNWDCEEQRELTPEELKEEKEYWDEKCGWLHALIFDNAEAAEEMIDILKEDDEILRDTITMVINNQVNSYAYIGLVD